MYSIAAFFSQGKPGEKGPDGAPGPPGPEVCIYGSFAAFAVILCATDATEIPSLITHDRVSLVTWDHRERMALKDQR